MALTHVGKKIFFFWRGAVPHTTAAAEEAKSNMNKLWSPEIWVFLLNQFLEGEEPVYHSETIIYNGTIMRSQDIKMVCETAL